MFEDAPVGLVVIDSSGVIQSVNRAFCSYVKYSEAELVGCSLLDVVPAEEREESLRRFHARASSSAGESVERRLRAKDGSDVWALVT